MEEKEAWWCRKWPAFRSEIETFPPARSGPDGSVRNESRVGRREAILQRKKEALFSLEIQPFRGPLGPRYSLTRVTSSHVL